MVKHLKKKGLEKLHLKFDEFSYIDPVVQEAILEAYQR